jgi:hypothetical protein
VITTTLSAIFDVPKDHFQLDRHPERKTLHSEHQVSCAIRSPTVLLKSLMGAIRPKDVLSYRNPVGSSVQLSATSAPISKESDYKQCQIVALPTVGAEPGDCAQKTLLDFCSRQLPLAARPTQYSLTTESLSLRIL